MQGILSAIGKDCLLFIDARRIPAATGVPVPRVATASCQSRPPTSTSGRSCSSTAATWTAIPPRRSARPGIHLLNIDHHHDNTRFGTVNLVVPDASCTAEIVWDLMDGLEVVPTPTVAEALYVGLITDTGRFMYENTGRRAHLMAADLIEIGVDVHAMYRHLYEEVPYGKLALLARGLANVQRYDDGRLTMTALSARTSHDSDAEESYSEGVIDHLRAVQGTKVAALVRERIGSGGDGPAQSLAARHRRRRRRVGDRARPGRRRAPPGGGLLDRPRAGRADRASCARPIAAQLMRPRPGAALATGLPERRQAPERPPTACC